jgi:AraC family transcriptional regulator
MPIPVDDTSTTSPFPPLLRAHQEWSGLPISLERLPDQGEVSNVFMPHATLALVRSGTGKRWLKGGGPLREFETMPGTIDLLESGFVVEQARWSGTPGDVIGIQLPEVLVTRLLHDDARSLNLQTRHVASDPMVTELMTRLWIEAENGSRSGQLYVQGLTLALIGLLDVGYGTGRSIATKRTGKFGPRDVERLRSLVIGNLSADLRIERLAGCVSMSPHHFARTFKATFGQTPHAFVLEQRVQAAAALLRARPHRNVAEIADDCGFTNHAHFTQVFRKMIGATPARWRDG